MKQESSALKISAMQHRVTVRHAFENSKFLPVFYPTMKSRGDASGGSAVAKSVICRTTGWRARRVESGRVKFLIPCEETRRKRRASFFFTRQLHPRIMDAWRCGKVTMKKYLAVGTNIFFSRKKENLYRISTQIEKIKLNVLIFF